MRRAGRVDVAMSSVLGLIGVIAPRGIHLFLIFLHGTPGQPFPYAERRGCHRLGTHLQDQSRLDQGAGDPNDMGLSEHELGPDPP